MSIINSQPLIGASGQGGGYTIAKSLRFRSSASAYLSRTPGSAGNRKTWTWSGWVKRGAFNAGIFQGHSSGNLTSFAFGGTGNTTLFVQDYTNGSYNLIWETSAVFRDPSAWYHFVIAYDTTQASSANAVKIYVNGVQQTLTFTAANGAYVQNRDSYVNNTNAQNIGTYSGVANYQDGYMADVYLIDGQQLDPSSFGETDAITGVWKPKAYTGTYGTNGFYLKFTDVATTSGSNAGLGKDFSGNGNYWTTNNISVTSGATYDSMKDVPTLTDTDTANYAVANPLAKQSDVVVSDGNLKISLGSVTGAIRKTNATIALPTTGKYYWESKNVGTTNTNFFCGIQALTASLSVSATGDIFYNEAGEIQNNGSATTGFGSITTNDILGMAYDADANKIYFYKNNTLQNSSGSTPSFSGPYTPFFGMYLTNNAQEINFGQRPFAYTPPTGFKALNTYNLPDSTIKAGNKYMDANLWNGNSSTQTITNAGGFKPDLVWVKARSAAYNNLLHDSVRGSTKLLIANGTDAEQTEATSVTSFNSNGFSLGSGGSWNNSGQTFVGWQWQAGQGTTSSNTSGSITSTVSVNASAGFSIVSWTGTGSNATVGHGLGVAPSLIITKNRIVGTTDWPVYHVSLGATKYIRLNDTGAQTTSAIAWNNTTPTSSVFSVGTWDSANGNGNAMVSYCWSEIAGFSKFGSYTGNGNSDGPFVYTGFRPKYILIKDATTLGNTWSIYDTARDPYNVSKNFITPQSSAAEADYLSIGIALDLVSNGFKIRGSQATLNNNADTYVYMAFAENPFKNSLAR
jgi:hypothetical protein